MRHFIFDCDDVLLDWIGGFRNYMIEKGLSAPASGPTSWSLAEWFDISEAEAGKLIQEFNTSPAFGELSANDDALAVIPQLKSEGHTLTILTSCSDEPTVVGRRVKNLRHWFGDAFPRIICLPLGQSKSHWLEVLRPGIWVEDNYKNAVLGHIAGHDAFAVRRSHNRSNEIAGDVIRWANDLFEVIHV